MAGTTRAAGAVGAVGAVGAAWARARTRARAVLHCSVLCGAMRCGAVRFRVYVLGLKFYGWEYYSNTTSILR